MAFCSLWCAAICASGQAPWCHCAAGLGNKELGQPITLGPWGTGRAFRIVSLMGPGFGAPEGKIVGIGGLPAGRLLGLDHLVGNTLAFAIGHRLLLGMEAD